MSIGRGGLRQILAASSGCIGCLIIGAIIGYTSPAIASMHDEPDISSFTISDEQESWIGSFNPLGALVGALVAGTVIDFFGRRRTLLYISTVGFALSWVLVATTVHIAMLFIARFIGGITVGLTLVTNSMYIVEISESKLRGMTGSFPQLNIVIGILYSYGIGSVTKWSTLAWVSLALVAPYAVALFLIPESPVWLIKRGRMEEAERSLKWLRLTDQDSLDKELRDMKKAIEAEQQTKVTFNDLKQRCVWKPFMIGMALMFFQQTCGVNAVIYFNAKIFEAAGASMSPNICAVIVGAIQVVATLVASQLVDRAGRRMLLIISGVSTCICSVLIGIFFFWKESAHNTDLVDKTGWLPLVSVMIFVVGFCLGLGPIPWAIAPEIIPPEVRSICVSVVNAFNWTMCFVITETFLPMAEGIGTYSAFWIYAGFSMLAALFVIFLIPETKGMSQEEIKELFA